MRLWRGFLLFGSLSKDDDEGNEDVISKYNFSFW